MPTTLTKDVAHETKDDLRDAFASLIGVHAGVFTDTHTSMAHAFRLFLPATDGGVGFTDPVTDRIAAYVANFVNCLPALMENDIVGPHVTDTTAWPQGPSQALKDAGVHIRQLAAPSYAPRRNTPKRRNRPPKSEEPSWPRRRGTALWGLLTPKRW